MTAPTVEPAGVSEAPRYFAMTLHSVAPVWAHEVVLADAYDALRQQLAELQRENAANAAMRGRWVPWIHGDELPRGNGLRYWVAMKDGTHRPASPGIYTWSGEQPVAYWSTPLPPAYDAALAPASQPSRGVIDDAPYNLRHSPPPTDDMDWQPQRCRCGGVIRQQLMGMSICGSCGRTP